MNCPKCEGSLLQSATVKGIEVDQCPRCRGVWFDEQELSRLLSAKPGALKPLTRGAGVATGDSVPGQCPRDGSTLMRVRSARDPAVIVDVCPKCRGVWLDGGELVQLLPS